MLALPHALGKVEGRCPLWDNAPNVLLCNKPCALVIFDVVHRGPALPGEVLEMPPGRRGGSTGRQARGVEQSQRLKAFSLALQGLDSEVAQSDVAPKVREEGVRKLSSRDKQLTSI